MADSVESNSQININTVNPVKVKISKRKVYIIATAIVCVIIIAILFFLVSRKQNTTVSTNSENSQEKKSEEKPKNVIAKVGNEYIYKEDLDKELSYFGGTKDPQIKKMLIDKLIKDSIILQAAQKDKLITLNSSVYNSPDKNYSDRINQVKSVQKRVISKQNQISGTMVSVWFNNQVPAKIGIAKGKEEALKKITQLHDKVANKQITIEDAGRLIATDPSYADLDPYGYKNNAMITFSNPQGKQIIIDSGFDAVLWNTKEGDVTSVYLGKTINYANQGPVEAYYIFGQVKKKITDGSTQDFSDWYNEQKSNYEVTYY